MHRFLAFFVFCLFLIQATASGEAWTKPAVVTLAKAGDGSYTLLRDGVPFDIKGVGGARHLELLKECGGNSLRTWGIETLEEPVEGKPLVKRAAELGLGLAAGIWVEHERHGFNYSDQKFLQKQREAVRAAVRKYKDEPALLIWSLGNEMEGPTAANGGNPRIWKELNVLAGIVKEEDPHHPVMTVIASADAAKIKGIMDHYPNIDILGVNSYAGASGVASSVRQSGWTKPFVLTEFGPMGHWEVAKTPWGAPLEPSSRDKAASYFATQKLVREEGGGLCLGTYAFLWGQKQETTGTWYGMFLKSGEKMPSVDAMTRAWTGQWPANRCPKIESFEFSAKNHQLAPGETAKAWIRLSDPEKDTCQIEWEVLAESTDIKVGGDAESEPDSFPQSLSGQRGQEITVKAPRRPGAYRLFVTVRDGQGAASKDNIPFLVKR